MCGIPSGVLQGDGSLVFGPDLGTRGTRLAREPFVCLRHFNNNLKFTKPLKLDFL